MTRSARPRTLFKVGGFLVLSVALYYHPKRNSNIFFTSSRSVLHNYSGTDLTYLNSWRLDATGRCADGEIQYAGLQLQHVGIFTHDTSALKRVLPAGDYQISSKLTSTCFTARVLHEDLANRSSINLNGDCLEEMEISAERTESIFLKGMKRPSRRCADLFDAFSVGYWLNGTTWKPAQCTFPELFVGEMKLPAYLVVHIAGDSVVRNMFGVFCESLDATMGYAFSVSGKKVRQHCCTANANICLTHRMTWFPLANFRPEILRENYPTKTAYCQNAPDEAVCLENTPEIMFQTPHSNTGFSVWHWLFYGSHSDLLGASNSTCELLRSLTAPKDETVLIFDTPAIREDLIPDKYSPQRTSRTNARISAISSTLANCVGRSRAFPIFPMTYALPESVFADAIHLNEEASALVARTVMSAFRMFLNITVDQ